MRSLPSATLAIAITAAVACQVDDPVALVDRSDDGLTAAPVLYAAPFHQSPVRGEPDELLRRPGAGAMSTSERVAYRRLVDTTAPLVPPAAVPDPPTPVAGWAPVVRLDAPHGYVVRLPDVMDPGASYALWVRTADGAWSNGVRINDARPQWLAPGRVFSARPSPGLPRELEIVGRNLRPLPGQVTRVRLARATPPATYIATALDPATLASSDHVVRIALPTMLGEGTWAVSVQRDGVSWVPAEQALIVLPDPPLEGHVDVAAQGAACQQACAPDDGLDDTCCVVQALTAAAALPDGVVDLGPGEWLLSDGTGLPGFDGILIPPGVDVRGAGAAATTVRRTSGFNVIDHDGDGHVVYFRSTFTLQRDTTISDVRFVDDNDYATGDHADPFLRLGPTVAQPGAQITDLTITRTVLANPFIGIGATGTPVQRVTITDNEIGAALSGIELAQGVYNRPHEDLIVRGNHLAPGTNGAPVAMGFASSRRTEVRGNQIDGADTTYGPLGFRAGVFFYQATSHDRLLVADNDMICTGARSGDGESVAFDANPASPVFRLAKPVVAASSNTLTVSIAGPASGLVVPDPTLHVNRWVHVTSGLGLGQARRILNVVTDPVSQTMTFVVAPAWDVVPGSTSRATFSRAFWQATVVGNHVSGVGCPAPVLHHQGVIALYATTIDSSVEGNLMEETGGLGGDPTYVEYPDDGGTIVSTQLPHLFVAIRHNQFLGEPAYGDPVSEGGVSVLAASYGAHGAPSTEVAAFGLDIAHNRFVDVDANALYGGAINVFVVDASTAGSASLRDTLIHHNDVAFSGPAAGRIGTRIWDANHTLASLVLDDNPVAGGCECEDPWAASTPLPPASCVPTCP